jgi:hypothetical protein
MVQVYTKSAGAVRDYDDATVRPAAPSRACQAYPLV